MNGPHRESWFVVLISTNDAVSTERTKEKNGAESQQRNENWKSRKAHTFDEAQLVANWLLFAMACATIRHEIMTTAGGLQSLAELKLWRITTSCHQFVTRSGWVSRIGFFWEILDFLFFYLLIAPKTKEQWRTAHGYLLATQIQLELVLRAPCCASQAHEIHIRSEQRENMRRERRRLF